MSDAQIRPAEAFIQGLVAQRASDATIPRRALEMARLPWVTLAMSAALVAVFVAQLRFGVAQPSGSAVPTTWTLLAFGGAMGELVLAHGQWYRLLAAPLLHANALHLAMNLVALSIAGRALEPAIGRLWFGAVFVIGGLGGAIASITFNTPETVSVGASGAILALCAVLLVASFHYSADDPRHTRMLFTAAFVLVPSLLPLSSTLLGMKIDVAAHVGGAAIGGLTALLLLRGWPHAQAHPGRSRLAAAMIALGLIGVGVAAWALPQQYQDWTVASGLAPVAELPKTEAEVDARAADLAARYPHDPRVRLMHAAVLGQAGDKTGAERELRAALAEETRWLGIMPEDVQIMLRTTLAEVVMETRAEEAREIARPVCGQTSVPPMRETLEKAKLCPQ